MSLERKIFEGIYYGKSGILTYLSDVTGTSFAIPFSSQEWNAAVKFLLDQPSGLAREVKIGDGRLDGWADGAQ